MSTEKLFKTLKKVQDLKSLVHTIFFYISIWDEIKKPQKA
jgi:hypothetical protein